MLEKYQAWFKTLPPALQSCLYAIESGLAAAVGVFLWAVYTATQTPAGLDGFNWAVQIRALEVGAIAAVTKALFDFLKGSPPSQVPSK